MARYCHFRRIFSAKSFSKFHDLGNVTKENRLVYGGKLRGLSVTIDHVTDEIELVEYTVKPP